MISTVHAVCTPPSPPLEKGGLFISYLEKRGGYLFSPP